MTLCGSKPATGGSCRSVTNVMTTSKKEREGAKMTERTTTFEHITGIDPAPLTEPAPPAPVPVWERVLKSPTGEGELLEYAEHPLNFNRSEGMARMIRGASGILGSLDLAILDLVIGLIQVLIERRGSVSTP